MPLCLVWPHQQHKRSSFVFWMHRWQAAAAPAAAFFEGYSCKYFLGHMFESCWIFAGILLLGLWKFTSVNSSTIGKGKTQKSEELQGFRDFSLLRLRSGRQPLRISVPCALMGTLFSRVRIGTTLTVAVLGTGGGFRTGGLPRQCHEAD